VCVELVCSNIFVFIYAIYSLVSIEIALVLLIVGLSILIERTHRSIRFTTNPDKINSTPKDGNGVTVDVEIKKFDDLKKLQEQKAHKAMDRNGWFWIRFMINNSLERMIGWFAFDILLYEYLCRDIPISDFKAGALLVIAVLGITGRLGDFSNSVSKLFKG
jgi:hypothetical protein